MASNLVVPSPEEIVGKLKEYQDTMREDGEIDFDVTFLVDEEDWDLKLGMSDMSSPNVISSATIDVDFPESELYEIALDLLSELDQMAHTIGSDDHRGEDYFSRDSYDPDNEYYEESVQVLGEASKLGVKDVTEVTLVSAEGPMEELPKTFKSVQDASSWLSKYPMQDTGYTKFETLIGIKYDDIEGNIRKFRYDHGKEEKSFSEQLDSYLKNNVSFNVEEACKKKKKKDAKELEEAVEETDFMDEYHKQLETMEKKLQNMFPNIPFEQIKKMAELALYTESKVLKCKSKLNEGAPNFNFINRCVYVSSDDIEDGNVPETSKLPSNLDQNRSYHRQLIEEFSHGLYVVMTSGYHEGACIDWIADEDMDPNNFEPRRYPDDFINSLSDAGFDELADDADLYDGDTTVDDSGRLPDEAVTIFTAIQKRAIDRYNEEIDRVNAYIDDIKETYGYTELSLIGVASNGEAFYKPVNEDVNITVGRKAKWRCFVSCSSPEEAHKMRIAYEAYAGDRVDVGENEQSFAVYIYAANEQEATEIIQGIARDAGVVLVESEIQEVRGCGILEEDLKEEEEESSDVGDLKADKTLKTNILLAEILPGVVSSKDLEDFELDGVSFTSVDNTRVIDGVEVLDAILAEIPNGLLGTIAINPEETTFSGIPVTELNELLSKAQSKFATSDDGDIQTAIENDMEFLDMLRVVVLEKDIQINIQDFANDVDSESEDVTTEEEPQETESEDVVEESYVIKTVEGKYYNPKTKNFQRLSKTCKMAKESLPYSLPGMCVRRDVEDKIEYFESELSESASASVEVVKG